MMLKWVILQKWTKNIIKTPTICQIIDNFRKTHSGLVETSEGLWAQFAKFTRNIFPMFKPINNSWKKGDSRIIVG